MLISSRVLLLITYFPLSIFMDQILDQIENILWRQNDFGNFQVHFSQSKQF